MGTRCRLKKHQRVGVLVGTESRGMNELTQGGVERKLCRSQGWEPGKGAWENVGTNHWEVRRASVTAAKRT